MVQNGPKIICVTELSPNSLTIVAAQEYVLVDTHKSLNVGTLSD